MALTHLQIVPGEYYLPMFRVRNTGGAVYPFLTPAFIFPTVAGCQHFLENETRKNHKDFRWNDPDMFKDDNTDWIGQGPPIRGNAWVRVYGKYDLKVIRVTLRTG